MTDKDILISDLNDISEILNNNGYGGWCVSIRKAVAMLKEHEAEISRVSNEYLVLVGKVSKQPTVVRCKDCKHRPIMPDDHTNGFDLEFPDGKCPCQCDDGWYSWYPSDDWFCADGERAENAR